MIKEYGNFTSTPDGSYINYTNENGKDWYELVREHVKWEGSGIAIELPEHPWATVKDGVITFVEEDPSRLVPDGTLVLTTDEPIEAGMGYDGKTFYEIEPVISVDDVDIERDNRIASGFIFEDVKYQSRTQDRENIQGAYSSAVTAVMAGAEEGDYRWHGGSSDFRWIAEDNNLIPMDAQTVMRFGQAAMNHKQDMIFKARELKESDPIPLDYQDNSYWS